MMKLVFYSLILNHHQVYVADEFYNILGDDYAFVETAECNDKKGASEEYSKRPYLVKAWKSSEVYNYAMELAKTAKVCVFSGYEALPFEKARMQLNMLSFDMGERMLKRGLLNLASIRILKMILAYHLGGWNKKNIYKLCMSAFAAEDQYKLYSFKNKCYKWGYFIPVPETVSRKIQNKSCCIQNKNVVPVRLMWCARFLTWKHPELVIELASRLKAKGYDFVIDMYGDEGSAAKHDKVYPRSKLESLVSKLGVEDFVVLHGNQHNKEIINAMKSHDIFLFTSDRLEGWGVVANESMANGCVLIASDEIGSTPYLVCEGFNGFIFDSCNVDSLAKKVEWLLEHTTDMRLMQMNAHNNMMELWSPQHAAKSLIQLIEDLLGGRDTSLIEGPCSKA